MYPSITQFKIWTEEPTSMASLMMQYIVSSIILELCYRWFAWGGWYPTELTPAVGSPDCPENPWVSLLDRYPEANESVEVFCVDGKERSGKAVERVDGYKGIVLELSREDAEMYKRDFWKIRPTHWRNIKTKEESANDIR